MGFKGSVPTSSGPRRPAVRWLAADGERRLSSCEIAPPARVPRVSWRAAAASRRRNDGLALILLASSCCSSFTHDESPEERRPSIRSRWPRGAAHSSFSHHDSSTESLERRQRPRRAEHRGIWPTGAEVSQDAEAGGRRNPRKALLQQRRVARRNVRPKAFVPRAP